MCKGKLSRMKFSPETMTLSKFHFKYIIVPMGKQKICKIKSEKSLGDYYQGQLHGCDCSLNSSPFFKRVLLRLLPY